MKVIYALCLLMTFSCTRHASVTKESVGTLVQDVEMEVHQLNEVQWFVGKKKERKISQSFTFIVQMPKVKEADLKFLSEKKGIDAWILRVKAVRGGDEQDLGSLYTLFHPRSKGRGSSPGPASSVTVKLYYAAAFASERFRMFRCPAFNHDRKISDMEIVGENEPFEIAVTGGMPYQERSQMIDLTPSSFNGGHSLIAEYFLEIAPYDSQKKLIHAPFKRLPMSVRVKEEKQINIESCAGIHPELQP